MIAPVLAAIALAGDCPGTQARTAFAQFVKAFNAGDTPTLDQLFAARSDFKWYSSGAPGERFRAAAANRRTLVPYFRARHAQGDHLTLLRFRTTSAGTLAHFSFVLRRSARDYKKGTPFRLIGKGAFSCALLRPAFIVMSLGGPGSA